MAIRDMLTDRMTVETPDAPTKDGSAGPVQSFSPVESNVPAQITPLSAGQRVTAAMAGMFISHKILCLYDGIGQGDRVRDNESGVYIRITGVQRIPARGGIEKHFILDGEEVKDGAP
ncbi:MAG: head-tail adaptor protein [Gemmataceae bacterium]